MFSAICVLLTFILIAQLTLSMQFDEQRNAYILYSSRNYSKHQIVIFDPKTGREINPMLYLPISVGNKRKPQQTTGNLIELPQLWNPCSCSDYSCHCCLGVRMGDTFNHKVCVSIAYNSDRLEIQLRIVHNQRVIINIGFSAQNPPTFCTPILLPFPVNSCLRTYDIRTFNGNIQICLSFILKFFMNELFELQFNCLRFGANGVQFVKPLQVELEDENSNELVEGGGIPAGTVGATDSVAGVGEHVEGDEAFITYAKRHPNRQHIELEENYSGISVEQPIDDNIFFRKGRVRGKKGLLIYSNL